MDSSKEVRSEFAFMPGITLKNNYRSGEYIDADLLVSATNVPNLIEGNFLKKGTNVVDFGATMHEGRVCGNFKRSSPKDHLANLSLVPGGMGPLVIRYLLMNFLKI